MGEGKTSPKKRPGNEANAIYAMLNIICYNMYNIHVIARI